MITAPGILLIASTGSKTLAYASYKVTAWFRSLLWLCCYFIAKCMLTDLKMKHTNGVKHTQPEYSGQTRSMPWLLMSWPITNYGIDSSPPSAAYMRQWTGSSLVQAIDCRLFGAKPLTEPMLASCQLDSCEHIAGKFESELYNLYSWKCNWKCRLPKWRPFFSRWRCIDYTGWVGQIPSTKKYIIYVWREMIIM